jgi:hypothetical protein
MTTICNPADRGRYAFFVTGLKESTIPITKEKIPYRAT